MQAIKNYCDRTIQELFKEREMNDLRGITPSGEYQYDNERLEGIMQEEYDKRRSEALREEFDNDSVNNPDHYQSLVPDIDVDCITAMRAAKGDEKVKAWLECNAFKYNWRFQEKGMDEDVKKAIWNLEKFLELGGCE